MDSEQIVNLFFVLLFLGVDGTPLARLVPYILYYLGLLKKRGYDRKYFLPGSQVTIPTKTPASTR